ncbi:MAG: hypothetical protein A2293_11990 [Elusimicrobia bacterium RIFOXYB2_FULL_49_7]|nr:MAG: hypothetical protein A2293_11990 [Elusimicrobia bacterium RIFOXYB2_FULL_49_7]
MGKCRTALIIAACGIAMNAYAAFDRQPGGARPQSLGGAFAGLADSPDAMYFNPAGIGQLKRMEVQGGYSRLYTGLDDNSNISDSNLLFVLPVSAIIKGSGDNVDNNGVLGFGLDVFGLSNYYTESSAGIYYSKNLNRKTLAGVGIKYLTVSYGSDEYTPLNPVFALGTSKSEISFDAGVMVKPAESLSLGLSIRDIASPSLGIKYEDRIPRNIILGAAYHQPGWNIVGDLAMDSNNNMKFVTGAEKWFMSDTLAVRLGVGIGSRKYSRFTTGLGYEGENAVLSYAFYYPLSGLNEMYGSHELTMGYRFGSSLFTNKKVAARLYDAVVSDIENGLYSRALSGLEKVRQLSPDDPAYEATQVKLSLVVVYIPDSTGEEKEAAAIRSGVNKYILSDDAKECVKLLRYAYSLNANNEKLNQMVKAIAKENNVVIEDAATNWNLAEQKVYQALERIKEKKYYDAVRLCEEALSLEPDNVIAYKRLGSVFYLLKDMEKAKKNWLKAIELAPEDADIPQIREILQKIKQ